MDTLADSGSRWFCAAAHAATPASFEMQACGDSTSRYWIGVTTILVVIALAIVVLWHLAFGERGVG